MEDGETNSNFGFNPPWWDRPLGTYRDQPGAGHEGMLIGIHVFLSRGSGGGTKHREYQAAK